ncbi:hypothetical protein [Algiphilus aromaticivorans]|uniref:hypothetical protein n=1 Tax=Algiphilus aromaticivorans TaxID=382454 RepID=UPI0005C1769E|nr:hypothetical protein [Algiphilus aromaticivorans]
MNVLAIDPGPQQSAIVHLDDDRILHHEISDNEDLIALLYGAHFPDCPMLAVEGIASYGMAVGADVFQTCIWIGRFIEAYPGDHELVYRRTVKLNLCGSARAKDPNVRQALIDRYGPGKDRAIGKKATPGPLYGIRSHEWSALAVGVTYIDAARLREAA